MLHALPSRGSRLGWPSSGGFRFCLATLGAAVHSRSSIPGLSGLSCLMATTSPQAASFAFTTAPAPPLPSVAPAASAFLNAALTSAYGRSTAGAGAAAGGAIPTLGVQAAQQAVELIAAAGAAARARRPPQACYSVRQDAPRAGGQPGDATGTGPGRTQQQHSGEHGEQRYRRLGPTTAPHAARRLPSPFNTPPATAPLQRHLDRAAAAAARRRRRRLQQLNMFQHQIYQE